MDGSSFICIDDVAKSFSVPGNPLLRVIEGFSLNVEQGSLVSVLGPSGCGKSTLLNLLNGLDDATSGSIAINGNRITSQARLKVSIGMVFQSPRLLNWMTVSENIKLPLAVAGLGKREAQHRAETYLDMVGLGGFGGYFPLRLSGGMQQRVSLARALALEPYLLLADEPFSALDEFTADRLRDEFVRLWHATGRTVIFVTHNIREAVFLSTRVVIVTGQPCRVFLDMPINAPYPRSLRDDELHDVEIEISDRFSEMQQADGGRRIE